MIMATRAATFTAKIRNLKDYHSRIINSILPLPNGTDIANTLKYFSQTLIGVLKDVPIATKELFVRRQTDRDCLQVFPDLNYLHLYETVESIVDIVSHVTTGQHALGESLLGVIGCLAPFLSSQILDTLPQLVASTLTSFPTSLHRDILILLCTNLLPITLGQSITQNQGTYATDSIPSILMLVFQFAVSKEYHSMIVECLMSLKKDVYIDLLCVIAYGTSASRGPAAHLFFYYWPQLNPIHLDRTGLHGTYIGFDFSARGTILCQKSKCINNRCVAAVMSCLDPRLIQDTTILPIHLCQSCIEELSHDVIGRLNVVVRRIERMELYCENEDCNPKSCDADRVAVCTCFSSPCILFNDRRPIRLCLECHMQRHKNNSDHVFHLTPPSLWNADSHVQVLMVDSIVSLLKEAENMDEKRLLEMGDERGKVHVDEDENADAKKLLSRYATWMLVQLVPIKHEISFEILGHLLSALFHWFDATTYLKDNVTGNALDRLKSKYLCSWLEEVLELHGDIVTACLLPHPLECFKVASCFDALSSRTLQIKEGLNQLLCLIPFNIITTECWNYIMPFWLEAVRTEVPTNHLSEFKIIMRKLFDVSLNASLFKDEDIFKFASRRFMATSNDVQFQTLSWLQILTSLQVFIPVGILIESFSCGVRSFHEFQSRNVKEAKKPTSNDESGVDESEREKVEDEEEEIEEKDGDDGDIGDVSGDGENVKNEEYIKCFLVMLDVLLKQIEIQDLELHKDVKDVMNQSLLDMLSSMMMLLLNKIKFIDDSLQVTLHQLSSKMVEFIVLQEEQRKESIPMELEGGDFDLSQIDVPSLSPHYRLLHCFAELINASPNVDCKFLCLTSVNLLCQHSNFLHSPRNDKDVQFYKHFSKYIILPGLWSLLTSEHNEVSSRSVSLLSYFVSCSFGAEVFSNLVEKAFADELWTVRFEATEKIAVVASYLSSEILEANEIVRSSLGHSFFHLIGSLDDMNSAVSVKAALLFETLSLKSLKNISTCLDHHFDLVINDRTLVLNKLHKLSTVLLSSSRNCHILSWDFFFNKIDILCLEAQIGLENLGEISHLEDLHHSDLLGDYFLGKVARARLALTRSDRIKSFKKCFCHTKQNTSNAPLIINFDKQHSAASKERKKSAPTRQQSATPLYRGRGSRFGAGLFTNMNVQVCGNLREFTDGESNLVSLLQKTMEFEDLDREALHLLISLLMNQFMLNTEIDDNAESTKSLNNVMWHLNVLLGYNPTEKTFTVPPYKLRAYVVFNSYLSGLAKVLDRNFKLGTMMLPFAMDLLQYSPSPQRYASDYQPPNYSLWYLEPYIRISWLQSLLIILYKYFYSNSEVVVRLIKITINTIDACFHQCKRKEENIAPPSPYLQRNRDTSNVSVGDLENIIEIETPPASPNQLAPSSPVDPLLPHHAGSRRSAAIADSIRSGSAFQGSDASRSSSPVLPRMKSSVECGKKPSKDKQHSSTEFTSIVQQRSEDDQARRIAEYNKISFISDDLPYSSSSFSSMKMKLNKEDLIMMQNLSSHADISKHHNKGLLFQRHEPPSYRTIGSIPENATESSSIILNASELLSKNLHLNTTLDVVAENDETVRDVAETELSHRQEKNGKIPGLIEEVDEEEEVTKCDKVPPLTSPAKPNIRARKTRKSGLSTVQMVNDIPELNTFISEHISSSKSRARRSEILLKHSEEQDLKQKQGSCSRSTDNLLIDLCPSCSTPLECYDEETVSTAIVCLATFIHREPTLAAPLLPNMFHSVARIAANSPFLWQSEQTGVVIPGNSMSTARQFFRCVLHQLAPNNVFPQLFTSTICEINFLKVMASTLSDFSELNCCIALQLVLEGLNEMKTLMTEQLNNAVINLSNFMEQLPMDSSSASWSPIVCLFETFFRKISILLTPPFPHINPFMKIIIFVLKMPAISSVKSILEPFSKVLSFAVQNCNFRLHLLMDICSLCGRAFTKERDKFYLSRCVVNELIQTIKFKQVLPDENFVLLVQMACLDAGGTLGPINIVKELSSYTFNPHSQTLVSTNIAECTKIHLADCIDFIADIHTTNKLKTNIKGAFQNLNEDTLGSHLKVGISQFIALEFSHSGGKDGRLIGRYMPWLFHPPSAMQQGPREFVDCICHIRILCWLLLGSLMHSAVTGAAGIILCRPLNLECCGFIADHIMVILTGFTGQSKTSVLHMSSLFHAFMLCQLWTIYCELQDVLDMPPSDESTTPHQTIFDFWGKVTPGILQLLSHSKVMSEMVNLHFLSLMEALQECGSTVLVKLFSLWVPILRSYHSQLPGHMQVRLQMCQNWRPTKSSKEPKAFCEMLSKWIKRMQFKLSQIEVQSSTATQFYAV